MKLENATRFFIALVCWFLLATEINAVQLPDEPTVSPNVLFIAVDDLNDWVGCLGGHSQAHTPNIDRLASRGMLFTNAHCQGTMCNPSRISLLWGQRPSTTGFYDNHYHVANHPEFLKSHVSLPAHFAASGYKTLTAGKVFHGGVNLKQQFHVVGPRSGQW
ncbi:MAG: sulfatase-like hydrolase/transferase, partial [Planctomycetaceae bacterium]|nr:sulfatase-like hydrolase/transferase [Planctomycetaceae bacterium]